MIRPMALPVSIDAPFVGAESVSVNSSLSSGVRSPLIVTVIVCVVCPSAKLAVPLAAR